MENILVEKSRRMMTRFLPCFKKLFRTCPEDPEEGWYGVNSCDSWAIQSNYNTAGALTMLAESPEELPGACMTREEMREYALKIFRHNLHTHCTGSRLAPDGNSWGCRWISVLGLERAFHALDPLQKHLTAAEREAFRRLREAEADFLLSDKYPVVGAIDAFSDKNKPESNIWNGSFLLRSALDFPEHPRAEEWRKKGTQFLLNGISIPEDRLSSELFSGTPLSAWHKGPNFTENFSLDHHAYLNVGYMVICLSNLAYLEYRFRSRGETAPPEAMFHAAELWNLVRNLIAPDGRLLRIGGDTRSRYTYCQCFLLPSLEFAGKVLRDPEAEKLETEYLRMIEEEQSANPDGGFYSSRLGRMKRESYFYYCRLESDPFCALSFLLASAGTPSPAGLRAPLPARPENFSWSDGFHGACVLRNGKSFRSFVCRANKGMMTLCFPSDRSDFAEWTRNMTGMLRFHEEEDDLKTTRQIFPDGFVADTVGTAMDWRPSGEGETPYPSLDVRYTAAALPDNVSMLCRHRVTAKREIAMGYGWQALHLCLPNDLFNGFKRTYCGENFKRVLDARKGIGEVLETGGKTLVCDGRLSLRALSGHTFKIIRQAKQNVLLNCGLTSLYADEIELDAPESPDLLAPGEVLFDIAWVISVLPQPLALLENTPMTPDRTPAVRGADGAGWVLVWPEDGSPAKLLRNGQEIGK